MISPSTESLPFASLRQYQIVRRIGRGPVGEVYEAVDPELHRAVAVKVLADETGADPDHLWRFYTQAAAAARLVHPNIVQIYYVGDDRGRWFYAMEYAADGSVADLIGLHDRPSLTRTVRMLEQVLAGLAALHERNIVHGNIKPSNILLDRSQGRVLLSDIGQAEQSRDSARPDAQSDAMVDLSAVGAIACRLLTGAEPAPANGSLKPPQFPDNVPAELAAVVRRLLATAASERYSSAREALRDLQPLLGATSPQSPARPDALFAASGSAAAEQPPARLSRATVISLPSFDVLPALPEGLFGSDAASWIERLNARVRDWLRRNTPEFLAQLRSTQFQVDAVVMKYERRREWLRKLEREAAAVLADLEGEAAALRQRETSDKPRQGRLRPLSTMSTACRS